MEAPKPEERTTEERLKAARERLIAAQLRREQHAKKLEPEQLEREAFYQETVAELEEKHGASKIRPVRVGSHLVILKRGLEVLWKKFQNICERSGKNPIPPKAVDDFVSPCVVFAALDGKEVTYAEFVEDQPACTSSLATELAELYGLKTKEDEGKF